MVHGDDGEILHSRNIHTPSLEDWMMPQQPIQVVLFRCDNCHMVQAVEAEPYRTDGRIMRPSIDCACGGVSWTQIKEVV